MVSMRSDARVPVPWNTCVCTRTHIHPHMPACVGRFLLRARVRRTRPHARSLRQGEEGTERGRKWGAEDARAARAWIMPRARCQIARHIVKYTTPRAVGNIMFSVPFPLLLSLSPRSRSPPSLAVDRSTFNHPRVSQPRLSTLSHEPSFPTLALSCVFLARFSPPRASRPSRFANKFARRTAIVLTSKRLRMQPPRNLFFCRSRYNRVVTR